MPLIFLDQYIGSTAPNSKMRDIWLHSMPHLIGGGVLESISGASVQYMDKEGKTFTPECFGKTCFIQHCSNALTKHSISSLSNSILLGPISGGMLPQNSTFLGKFEESLAHIFPSFVIPQDLDFPLRLGLCKCLECLESIKDIRLGFYREHKVKS